MADAAPEAPRRRWLRRLLSWTAGILLALVVAAAAFMAFLDTGPGHRLIVDRIAALSPHSGLRIRIGRIDGSIWSDTRLKDVRVYDPHGLFAESPEIDLNWRPLSYIFNQLVIHRAHADLVILHRMPRLIPSERPGPLMPSFDVLVGRLDVAQLRLGAPVTGRERTGRLAARAAIRDGRAFVDLQVEVRDSGDLLLARIDAEPDRDRFDIDAHVRAPPGGFAGALLGTRRPVRLDVDGNGTWSRWDGTARLDISGRRTADLALRMESGRFRMQGWTAPSPFLTGKKQRLTAPRVLVDATGTFAHSRIDGARLSLRSAALRIEARGGVDLSRGSYESVQIAAELIRPPALFPNMTGRQVRAAALLDGRFGHAEFVYRVTSPHIAFDDTGFDEFRLAGSGHLSPSPVMVPALATASRVTGVGDVAGDILANLRLRSVLQVTPQRLTGQRIEVSSNRLRGSANLVLDLITGVYVVNADAQMPHYAIPGVGLVDVLAQLRAVPGAGGHGTSVAGTARAQVTRFDNGFLNWVAGGLPRLETALTRGPDRIVHFNDLRIAAPSLALAASGFRRIDGTFSLQGSGRHADYGPLQLSLDGHIDHPRVALRFDHPVDALGLADVRLDLDPTDAGFAWRAAGGSTLGPFAGNGAILLPSGRPATIQVAALNVSGTRASGALRSDPSGFTGRLDVNGGGLAGRLAFAPLRGHQRNSINLAANDAHFVGPPPIVMRRGTIEGVVLLDPAGTSVEGHVAARGLSRGQLYIASLDATASLRGGVGQVRARVAGSRGRGFAFTAVADVAPGRYRITGRGTLDRRPLELASPAELTRVEGGWRLAPTRLRFAGGNASLSGLLGDRTEIDAELDNMPLTVIDIAYPDLGLGGEASGRLHYRFPAGGAPPAGEANLRIHGLTRSGLVLSSRPVDIGLVARLDEVSAAMRAVAMSEGRTIGRAQARISPIGGGGTLYERLERAPMRAQLRYNGAADTLWRLTGIELLDLSGPVAVGTDISGTLDNPRINGSVRTAGARLESAVTGLVIENLEAAGRFGGSRLELSRFAGHTPGGGTVTGTGALDFAAARGVGMRFDLHAEGARLLDRDDIRAAVTGDIAIRSDGEGGSISGDVRMTEGRFRLGSATNAAQVPHLNVTEINREDVDLAPEPRRLDPWRLALNIDAPNRLTVTGLGMNSEWSAQLRVAGTVTDPAITGEAHMIRGTYDFAGRHFDLTRGNIRFLGELPINPQLDIAAEARLTGLSAEIRVTGRSDRPEIAFTSTPALPQDELLSRILFGTSITNLSAPEAIQLAAAVASLNNSGGGLDPINAVRQAIGLDRLRIVPADVTQGIGTAIAAGRYFGRHVYVEVITDGRGYSATTVEYQITRWLSLLSSVSTIGRESANVRVSRDY